MDYVIKAEGLTKEFQARKQNVVAIDAISLAITKGERVAFIGAYAATNPETFS